MAMQLSVGLRQICQHNKSIIGYRGVAKQKTIGGPLLVTKAVAEEGVATCGYMHSVQSALRACKACSPFRGVWGHAPPGKF